jgi:hypothetical protein
MKDALLWTTLPLHKYTIKATWTYGIQLLGCTKLSNTKITQRFRSKVLCSIIIAPWYLSNLTPHNDLQILFVIEEILRVSTLYHQNYSDTITDYSQKTATHQMQEEYWGDKWPSDLHNPQTKKPSHHNPVTELVRVSSGDDFCTQDTYLEQIHSLLQNRA